MATDDCNPKVTERVVYDINSCGVGEIRRSFIVNDGFHGSRGCTQFIRIFNRNPFTEDSIDWPNDTTIFGCMGNLDPSETGEPGLDKAGECANVHATYHDQVFNVVEGACFKVLREWTVVDHCSFTPRGGGIFKRTQVIKVLNNDDPYFTSDCTNKTFFGEGSNCSGEAELIAEAEDDCTDSEDLIYSYRIDLDNDGDFEINGTGNDASGTYPGGTHRIVFKVEDQCENEAYCSFLFTIQDGKKPTPYCRTGIITVVMESTGSVTVWASDLNANSFDNCTESRNLRYAFSEDPRDQSRTYTCDSLDNGIEQTFELKIYVFDQSGNFDFCTTKITIQDNIGDACPDNVNVNRATIAGLITTEEAETVEDVEVSIMASMPNYPKYQMTKDDGHYAFINLPLHENYFVGAVKNTDPKNGVSTKDIVMIQKDLLAIEELNSPYKRIAADVNNDQKLSAKDLVELRKLILGVYTKFPNNDSWRFIPSNYQFDDPKNPFPYKEEIELSDLVGNQMSESLIAIKVGDVDGNAKVNQLQGNQSRNNKQYLFEAMDAEITSGELVELTIKAHQDIVLDGFQFTLRFDHKSLQYSGVEGYIDQFTTGNIGLSNINKGIITMSWNADSYQLKKGQDVMKLNFRALSNGKLNHLVSINSDVTASEIYPVNGEDGVLELRFVDPTGNWSDDKFELYQNKPNPFSASTKIGFQLPEAGYTILSIYNMAGELVYEQAQEFDKGYHEIDVSAQEVGANNILYYRLETEKHTATRKMLLIE